MTATLVKNCAIRGIVSALPSPIEGLDALSHRFDRNGIEKIAAATGIYARHIVPEGQTTADLGLYAAKALLDNLGWDPASIGLLIFVTQTPDYPLPSNAHLIHRALNMASDCIAYDVNLGCSGYVYGLWQAASLLGGLSKKRTLLIVGDTTSTTMDQNDRAVAPLFGDAATATALEWDANAAAMSISLGSDGTGAPYLIQKESGTRTPGNPRSLFMDGTQVFAFTLREVPKNINAAIEGMDWTIDDIDHYVLHQANAMMLNHLAKKIGIPKNRLLLGLSNVGNTSSATIALCITDMLADKMLNGSQKLLFSGFGVGWSWGSIALETGPWQVSKTLIVPADYRGAALFSS